ncbi:MAG: SDR family oxidoreductase, partial [Pseudomonadota bacterium]
GLLEHGCRVIVVDRAQDALDAAAETLVTRGAAVETHVADLEDATDRAALIDAIGQRPSGLDILVNNAAFVGDSGLAGWATPFEQQSVDTWRRALEVNLTAPFHLSQAFAPLLTASGHGSIINIGSIYGVVGPDLALYEGTSMGNPAAYAAGKGGLLQLTRWLSTVLAPAVRVNAISPGGIARGQSAAFVDRYLARTPMQRMGTEEDFQGAAHFLASDLSRWVTGQNIVVDGGWTAW